MIKKEISLSYEECNLLMYGLETFTSSDDWDKSDTLHRRILDLSNDIYNEENPPTEALVDLMKNNKVGMIYDVAPIVETRIAIKNIGAYTITSLQVRRQGCIEWEDVTTTEIK